MQIFFSHSSQQKPLVREVRKGLPHHLGAWIDEEKLLFGDEIAATLEQTIKTDTDYVLLFIDSGAVASPWVQREFQWALDTERRLGRTIVLPIALDESAVPRMNSAALEARKYLVLQDFRESSVKALADAITSELFAMVCRDVHRAKTSASAGALAIINGADQVIRDHAELIQKAVFPHRRSNPIDHETLRRVLNSQVDIPLDAADFASLLSTVVQRNLVPGLHFDGDELFVVEEHSSWKSALQRQKKELIAKRLAGLVRNGASVFIDAGSTSEQLVQIICRRIETRAITRLTVATTSISIADMISDCCVKMGFDDDFSAVKLFVPGGQVRPGTQAIIPLAEEQRSQIDQIADVVGGFDLAVLGVNGVDIRAGFTTHEPTEALNKIQMIASAKRALIAGDSSKVGISLECAFASFEDEVSYVVDNDPANDLLQELASRFSDKLIFA